MLPRFQGHQEHAGHLGTKSIGPCGPGAWSRRSVRCLENERMREQMTCNLAGTRGRSDLVTIASPPPRRGPLQQAIPLPRTLALPQSKRIHPEPNEASLHVAPSKALDLISNIIYVYFNFYFERESASVSQGGAERERERGRQKIPSRLHTVSTEPKVGLELTNHEIVT